MAWRLKWFATEGEAFAAGPPVGGIWRAQGHLFVRVPSGLADITTWDSTGPDERLTVSPSILHQGGVSGAIYHGFIREGVLTDDIDGRAFPDHPATT